VTVWSYPLCTVLDVHDGDTVKVDIDHGMGIWSRGVLVRLVGVAARELRDPGGPEARDHLAGLLPVGAQVHVDSHGWDKYAGRILGVIFLPVGGTAQEEMVASGYAAVWKDGRGKQPQPPWPRP